MDVNTMISQLSDEQKEKARACTTAEEFVALAMEEGFELTDDQIDAVSGAARDLEWYENCLTNGTCSEDVCYHY